MPKLERILHVEDDHDIREIAKMSLEMLGGFTLLQCAGGREALTKAVEFDPQLLLLDVMMPTMSGEETLAGLREFPSLKDCPAVFVTAKAQENEIDELKANNSACGVVVKPFDPMTLAQTVEELWAKANAG